MWTAPVFTERSIRALFWTQSARVCETRLARAQGGGVKSRAWHIIVSTLLLPTTALAGTLNLTSAQRKRVSDLPADEKARVEQILAIDDALTPQYGVVQLPGTAVHLNLTDKYYYLTPRDARRVLVDGWHNPASSAESTLGLIFPKGSDWTSGKGWGANVTFDKVGLVSSVDKSQRDFAKVDEQLKNEESAINAKRAESGAPALHYVGWAEQPSYNDSQHSVIWARDIKFSGQEGDTLNYDVRKLGRYGVLSLNAIAAMEELPAVRNAMRDFASRATFDPGGRYEDYVDGDKKAGYGIAGLVAGGVGLAVAKKLGFIALITIFAKKFVAVFVAAGLAAIAGVSNLFKRKPAQRD